MEMQKRRESSIEMVIARKSESGRVKGVRWMTAHSLLSHGASSVLPSRPPSDRYSYARQGRPLIGCSALPPPDCHRTCRTRPSPRACSGNKLCVCNNTSQKPGQPLANEPDEICMRLRAAGAAENLPPSNHRPSST